MDVERRDAAAGEADGVGERTLPLWGAWGGLFTMGQQVGTSW